MSETSEIFSPTEPPSDPQNPPKPIDSESSLFMSTDICSNKLNNTVKDFQKH